MNMGCFDTIIYECQSCGKKQAAQTKLGPCMLDTVELGSKTDLPDGIIVMKSPCYECGEYSALYINKGWIKAIIPAKSIIAEEAGGNFKTLYDPEAITHNYAKAMEALGINVRTPEEAIKDLVIEDPK
jgi:hypothetical protein